MALPQEFLMELKYKNDIESVLSPYVALKRRGSNLVGLCPFHNEKTPSFTVYPENGSYYCFGCGQGGDIITFIMRIENLDYMDAVSRLADRAGLRMPENGQDDRELKLKNDIYEANREAALFYHSYLLSEGGRAGLDYFLSRGLTPKTIRHFGLGFAPDDWHALQDHLRSKGISDYVMRQADLVAVSNKTNGSGSKTQFTYDRFRNRVMFPIINIHGKVIGFGGRAMPGNEKQGGKYINTSDTPVFKKSNNMYAMNFAKSCCSKQMILVEGNIDVISLHQAGFCNTVAALGTSFTEEQARLLGRYTKEVVITLDADAAGEKATDRAMKILDGVGVEARVLRLPECKDPDEYIKKFGAARFGALLEGTVSDIEYRLYTAAKEIDLDAPDGRLQYLKKACGVLAELDDSLAVDLYAGRLSEKYGVSKDVLLKNTADLQKKQRSKTAKKQLDNIIRPRMERDAVNPEKQQHRRAAAAEEAVICVLIKHPDLASKAEEELPPDNMLTEFDRRVYRRILEIENSGSEFDLMLLGGDFTPDEIGAVTRIMTGSAGKDNPERVLLDSIKVINEEREALSDRNIDSLPDDEWAEKLRKLTDSKKKR